MVKNKERIKFIEEIDEILHCDIEDKDYLIMKVVLLKFLIDNKRIDGSINMEEIILGEFTFENIIYNVFKEEYILENDILHILSKDTKKKLLLCILNRPIFKDEDPIILGEVYEFLNSKANKKKQGMFYTPSFVIKYMVKNSINELQRDYKIMDPACGSGFFLSILYDQLMDFYLNNPCILGKDGERIHNHILKNHIFGIEKNPLGVLLTKIILILKGNYRAKVKMNIFCKDTLLEEIEEIKNIKFSLIIGNPPYVGHKKIDKDYRQQLSIKYSQVFQDKGDLSYCFFQKGMELLKEGGKLSFITSRYFLEAFHGTSLRKFLADNFKINTIIDFYGQRILKGIQVDPLIITLEKSTKVDYSKHKAQIYRLKNNIKKVSGHEILNSIENFGKHKSVDSFFQQQDGFKEEGWRLLSSLEKKILSKIENSNHYILKNICTSRQGIITGRDRAFIVEKNIARDKKLNSTILKPWIKGKNISPFHIEKNQYLLIYSNEIKDIDMWYKEKEHLLPFKSQLENRRECVKGIRKWYELQWGREKEDFEKTKIVFPYKSKKNRFALDKNSNFYSADIYSIRVNKDLEEEISYKSLTLILNSMLFEFYFKRFAKKLGEDLYEYYPNTLLQLKIPKLTKEENQQLKNFYNDLAENLKKGNNEEVENIKGKSDHWLMDYFNLNQEEKSYIKEKCANRIL